MSQEHTDLPCAVVVIPTYNEAHNIGKLLDELVGRIFPSIAGWRMKALVVDDSSPDGTALIVERKMSASDQIFLLSEPKKSGIGSAYVRGFSHAMKVLGADAVIEYDADFQHPPETIPRLLKKISEGCDYVVGSRNVPGGSEPRSRNIFRIFFTVGGGYLARLILFFPGRYFRQVTDPTSGLKATRVKGFIDRMPLDPEHLYSRSFGYKVQLLAETLALGARYAEVPLDFQDRAADRSKFSFWTVFDVLGSCLRTRLHRNQI